MYLLARKDEKGIKEATMRSFAGLEHVTAFLEMEVSLPTPYLFVWRVEPYCKPKLIPQEDWWPAKWKESLSSEPKKIGKKKNRKTER